MGHSPERRSRYRSPERSSRHHSSERGGRHRSRSEDRKRRHRDRSESMDEDRSSRHKKKDKKHKKEKKYKSRYSDNDLDEEAERKRQAAEVAALGYSNVNNPFNDVNLESKFVWGKKKSRDKKTLGYSEVDLRRRERDRKKEADEELAKLNKRRAEREREIELREEEQARIQRDAELAQMGDWEAKEEEFHLEQAKQRAAIRIRDGRAKPIDILAMNLRLANEPDKVEEEVDLEIDLDEPYTIFENLSLGETDELHKDIQMHLTLEKNPMTLEFWRAMIVVAEDALFKLRENEERVQSGKIAIGVNQEMDRILNGKSVSQLSVLQNQIVKKLSSNEPIDVEYWENLLKELIVYKAKAKLNEMHQEILSNRLTQLRDKQREEALKVQEELERVLSMHTEHQEETVASSGLLLEEYQRSMSPTPMASLSKYDMELEIVDPLDDIKELMENRKKVLNSKIIIPRKHRHEVETQAPEVTRNKDESIASTVLFEQEAAKGVDEDEDLFNIEAELQQQTYNWQDIYRPRKPRYFNRVHTGYEWNKYNQTHYDLDNPPPKVVQGYKFNIFYPDLIDKSVAPTYYIDKDPDSQDTVLIRFHAGPPYEDIAFRIVNREWEYSHKKGFRCSFDRGVLSLWFHFKRQFYRK